MFEKLRKPKKARRKGRLKSIFSYIVFGAICLVFVFLSPMSSQLLGEGVLAYVGSEPIRSREFRLTEARLRAQYQERLNKASIEESEKLQETIRQAALQSLISEYLVFQAAEHSGFMVSDKELQDEITSYPVFQRKGRFVYSQYLDYLKNQRLSSSRFEARVRRFKTIQNWRDIFFKSILFNVLEKNKDREGDLYQIKLRFAEVSLSKVKTEELYPLVYKGDVSRLNGFLRKHKIQWKIQKEMSLAHVLRLPFLKDKSYVERLIDILPKTGLVPQLLTKGDTAHVVEVLSFKVRPSSSIEDKGGLMLSTYLKYQKSEQLFNKWMTAQKERFPVKQSQEI